MLGRPYREQVGLWLNIPRIRKAQALAVATGVRAGQSAEALADLRAAQEEDPKVAATLRGRAQADAETRRLKARWRGR